MIVIKLDHNGVEKVRYPATLLHTNTPNGIAVRAEWTTPTITTETTTFANGDYLHEFFYTDRWYNVFTLYAGKTGQLKGWYCNVTRPSQITNSEICWSDLALDVWVNPDGTVVVLDEAEFATLQLDQTTRQACWKAVAQIKALAAAKQLPM